MNEQFADMLIKNYVVRRRLLKGLKFAAARLLSMDTILELVRSLPKTHAWLGGESKLDLRLRFPALKSGGHRAQVAQSALYELIELRARVRAANDFVALSADNIERILRAIQLYLIHDDDDDDIDSPHHSEALRAHLLAFGRQMLDYYTEQARDNVADLSGRYDALVDRYADELMRPQVGAPETTINATRTHYAPNNVQQVRLTHFLDEFINAELLDIAERQLSRAANGLPLPPTITRALVLAQAPKWIHLRSCCVGSPPSAHFSWSAAGP